MAFPRDSDKWFFSKEQLLDVASTRHGLDWYTELAYRKHTAQFMANLSNSLTLSHLCLSTAIVYMHRFYVFHSFTTFTWYEVGEAAVFLAAKVENQARCSRQIIKFSNFIRRITVSPEFDRHSEKQIEQCKSLAVTENVLLQTLNFELCVEHPFMHLVKYFELLGGHKEFALRAYQMVGSLLFETMLCIRYRPTVVACICIYLVKRFQKLEIPLPNGNEKWFSLIDASMTDELFEELGEEVSVLVEKTPKVYRGRTKITEHSRKRTRMIDQCGCFS